MMSEKDLSNILSLPHYAHMKTDGEDDEEKPSIRWAFKNPIFLAGLFEILASYILIVVTIKSNVFVLGTSYWVGFGIPAVIAIFTTSPAVMGTLLCANVWYKKKNLYKAYLGLGQLQIILCSLALFTTICCSLISGGYFEPKILSSFLWRCELNPIGRILMIFGFLVLFSAVEYIVYKKYRSCKNDEIQHEAKTCGSTLIACAEIIEAGVFYWLIMLGIDHVTFFDDWKFFTTGPIWIAMLVVFTLLCFIKKPWVYRLYLRFSTIRAGFASFLLAIMSYGNIQARVFYGYEGSKIIEVYTNVLIVLAILLVINIVFGMVVRREYKKKEAEKKMDQFPPHPY